MYTYIYINIYFYILPSSKVYGLFKYGKSDVRDGELPTMSGTDVTDSTGRAVECFFHRFTHRTCIASCRFDPSFMKTILLLGYSIFYVTY